MPAELTQCEGAGAADIVRNFQAAAKQNVSARAGPIASPQVESRACAHGYSPAACHRHSVQGGAKIRAGDRNLGITVEAQGWPCNGTLQARRTFGIAQQ